MLDVEEPHEVFEVHFVGLNSKTEAVLLVAKIGVEVAVELTRSSFEKPCAASDLVPEFKAEREASWLGESRAENKDPESLPSKRRRH
jgi:hypothetical protein